MEFLDRNGHIFSLPSYEREPIGYEYDLNDYIFWIDSNVTSKLSINNYYVKTINIVVPFNYTDDNTINNKISFDILISNSKVFSLLSPVLVSNLVNNNEDIITKISIDDTQLKNELTNDDLICIKVSDDYQNSTNNYLIVPIYVVGNSSDIGTWNSNVLIHINYLDDDTNDWCNISVGGEFEDTFEELEINGTNMGVKLPKEIIKAVYQESFYNDEFNEALYNEKLKEFLVNYMCIRGERGNFSSVINSLKWFGYNDKISISKLLKTDNNIMSQYINDYFDINSDLLKSFNKFKNTSYISLKIMSNAEKDDDINIMKVDGVSYDTFIKKLSYNLAYELKGLIFKENPLYESHLIVTDIVKDFYKDEHYIYKLLQLKFKSLKYKVLDGENKDTICTLSIDDYLSFNDNEYKVIDIDDNNIVTLQIRSSNKDTINIDDEFVIIYNNLNFECEKDELIKSYNEDTVLRELRKLYKRFIVEDNNEPNKDGVIIDEDFLNFFVHDIDSYETDYYQDDDNNELSKRYNEDFWGEGKPVLEDLFNKYIKVNDGTKENCAYNYWKPYYDYCFNELAIKLSCLKYYYEEYFLPLHIKVHSASIAHTVHMNDIKFIQQSNEGYNESPIYIQDQDLYVSQNDGKDEVEFENHHYVWLTKQIHFVDDQYNEYNIVNRDDTLFYINDTCCNIPIKFKSYEKPYNCVLLLEKYRDIDSENPYKAYINQSIGLVVNLDLDIYYNDVLQNNNELYFAYSYDRKSYSPYYFGLDKMIDAMLSASKKTNIVINVNELFDETYEYYINCDDIYGLDSKYSNNKIKLTYETQIIQDRTNGTYVILPSISDLKTNPMDHTDVIGTIYTDIKPIYLSFKTNMSDNINVSINGNYININNIKINMIPETDLLYESHFTVCQHENKDYTNYRDFVIYPKMLNNASSYYDYWCNEKFKIHLLVNGKWYDYDFIIKMPECKVDMGTLQYKYFVDSNDLESRLKYLFGEYYNDNMTVCYLFKNILFFEYEVHVCNDESGELENVRKYGKAVDIISNETNLIEFELESDPTISDIKNTIQNNYENIYSEVSDNLIDNNVLSKFSQIKYIDDENDRIYFNSFMWEPKLVTTNNINFFNNYVSNAFLLNTRYIDRSDIDKSLFVDYNINVPNNKTIHVAKTIIEDDHITIPDNIDEAYIFKYNGKYCYYNHVYENVFILLNEDEIGTKLSSYSKNSPVLYSNENNVNIISQPRYSESNLNNYIDKYVNKHNIGLINKYKNKMFLFDIYESYYTYKETFDISPNVQLNANGMTYQHGIGRNTIYLSGKLNGVSDSRKLDIYTILSYGNGLLENGDISIDRINKFKCYIELDGNGNYRRNDSGNIILSSEKSNKKKIDTKYLGYAIYNQIPNNGSFNIYNYIKTDITLFDNKILNPEPGICKYIDNNGDEVDVTYQIEYVDKDYNPISPSLNQLKYNIDIYYKVLFYYDVYEIVDNVEFDFPIYKYSNIYYDKDKETYYLIYIDGKTEYELNIDNDLNNLDGYEYELIELVRESGFIYYDRYKNTVIPDDQPGLWYWYADKNNDIDTFKDTLTQWSFDNYSPIENNTNELIDLITEFINKRDDKTLREDFNYDHTPEKINDTLKYEDYYDNLMVKILDPSKDYGEYNIEYTLSDELSNLNNVDARICAYIQRADGTIENYNDENDNKTFILNEDDKLCVIYIKVESKDSETDFSFGNYWIMPSLKKKTISEQKLKYIPTYTDKYKDVMIENINNANDSIYNDNVITFNINNKSYTYGYNLSKYVKNLYDDFFENKMSITGIGDNDYYIDEIYNIYEGKLMIDTPILDYDFYLMHDNEYWYGVYISKSTMEYVTNKNEIKIKNIDSNGYINGVIESSHYNNKSYRLKYVTEDEEFLINRYYYKSSNGYNHFNNDDIIVAYVENNDRLPINIYQGTKWKVDPLTIGVDSSSSQQSSTEMTIINYPDKSNNYKKGYYNLTVRYCVDRDNNHQQFLRNKFKVL